MRKFLLTMFAVLSALTMSAQYEFPHDAVLVSNGTSSFTVRISVEASEKKQVTPLAVKSAIDTYLFYGIEGVNDGKPLLDKQALTASPDYFDRLYNEGRCNVFVRKTTEQVKPKKLDNGNFSATILVEIGYKALLKDIESNNLIKYGNEPTPQEPEINLAEIPVPTVIVLPDVGYSGKTYYEYLISDKDMLTAIDKMQLSLYKKGVKTVDFKSLYDATYAKNGNVAPDEKNLIQSSGAGVALLLTPVRKSGSGGNGVKLGVKAVSVKDFSTISFKEIETRYFKTNDYAKIYSFASTRACSEELLASLKSVNLSASDLASAPKKEVEVAKNLDPIDTNIPSSASVADDVYAVIIGNEAYKYVAEVPFAVNDAEVFAKYCHKTLGLPEDNIRVYKNATYGDMLDAIDDIKAISEVYNGDIKVVFYYAGHGVPDESTKNAYLLPVDARSQQMKTCYAVEKLYSELGALGVNSVTVFLDACFSGSLRGDGMIASARGIALKPKADEPKGNMVVFTAASGDETAYPYTDKGHGMFTYFLLLKLQETAGNVTLGELSDYITEKVRQNAQKVNRKSQTPTTAVSMDINASWRNLTVK